MGEDQRELDESVTAGENAPASQTASHADRCVFGEGVDCVIAAKQNEGKEASKSSLQRTKGSIAFPLSIRIRFVTWKISGNVLKKF